jgi:hypothetical protein
MSIMVGDWNDPLAIRRREIGMEEWPYGVDEVRQQEKLIGWVGGYGLRFADTNRRCVHWLITGRSDDIAGRYTPRGTEFDDQVHVTGSCGEPYGFDHVTCWTYKGKPAVLVYQPYNLDEDNLKMLGALDRHGLEVHVDGRGWYGGGTICVEIWGISRNQVISEQNARVRKRRGVS